MTYIIDYNRLFQQVWMDILHFGEKYGYRFP